MFSGKNLLVAGIFILMQIFLVMNLELFVEDPHNQITGQNVLEIAEQIRDNPAEVSATDIAENFDSLLEILSTEDFMAIVPMLSPAQIDRAFQNGKISDGVLRTLNSDQIGSNLDRIDSRLFGLDVSSVKKAIDDLFQRDIVYQPGSSLSQDGLFISQPGGARLYVNDLPRDSLIEANLNDINVFTDRAIDAEDLRYSVGEGKISIYTKAKKLIRTLSTSGVSHFLQGEFLEPGKVYDLDGVTIQSDEKTFVYEAASAVDESVPYILLSSLRFGAYCNCKITFTKNNKYLNIADKPVSLVNMRSKIDISKNLGELASVTINPASSGSNGAILTNGKNSFVFTNDGQFRKALVNNGGHNTPMNINFRSSSFVLGGRPLIIQVFGQQDGDLVELVPKYSDSDFRTVLNFGTPYELWLDKISREFSITIEGVISDLTPLDVFMIEQALAQTPGNIEGITLEVGFVPLGDVVSNGKQAFVNYLVASYDFNENTITLDIDKLRRGFLENNPTVFSSIRHELGHAVQDKELEELARKTIDRVGRQFVDFALPDDVMVRLQEDIDLMLRHYDWEHRVDDVFFKSASKIKTLLSYNGYSIPLNYVIDTFSEQMLSSSVYAVDVLYETQGWEVYFANIVPHLPNEDYEYIAQNKVELDNQYRLVSLDDKESAKFIARLNSVPLSYPQRDVSINNWNLVLANYDKELIVEDGMIKGIGFI